MSYNNGPKIVTKNLITCFDAASKKSYPGDGSIWYDLIGNNDGNFVSDPVFENTNLGVITFNGTDQYVNCGLQTYGQSVSWEVVVYPTSFSNSYNMFLGKYVPYFCFRSTGRILFSNRVNAVQRNLTPTKAFTANQWYYLSFVSSYDGVDTTSSIYVNGVFLDSRVDPGPFTNMNSSLDTLCIGNWRALLDGGTFPGKIASVRIYNKALSSQEIEQNFNAVRGRFGL